MATKNIVPRANNQGELGTSSKKWNEVNATTVTATNFVGNGSSITGVTAEWDGSHTGNATIAGNLSASINISASAFYGSGANLTGISSYSVANDANNRVVTATGATNGNAEANLTFDGSTLTVTGDTTITGNVTTAGLVMGSTTVTQGELARIDGATGGTIIANKVVIADASKNIATLGTVGCGAITSTGDSTFQNLSASINVSASAFYGKTHVEVHSPAGHTYPILGDGASENDRQLSFDASLSYNSSMNRLYVGTIQTSTTGYFIADSNSSHPTEISNKAIMYAISGEMYVKDSSGNQTLISPHDDEGEWQYFSKNTKTGKVVRVRMEKMIRKLEEITGESFIEEE
jgi:hypothetical protein